jgi:predicted HTH domain antitoxin
MEIEIELPEDVARRLEAQWGTEGLPRKALEALVVEAYRSGAITAAEVQRVLGLSSRWEAEAFLKRAQAHLDYAESDLEEDASAIRQVSPR